MNETMPHLPDGVLQAHLDGELTIAEAARVERHLSECAECARELELLRGGAAELSRALGLLDDTPAMVPPLRTTDRGSDELAARRGGRGQGWAALPRAAVLVLGFAAAAAAAIPGSPVRGWIESLLEPESDEIAMPTAEPTAAPEPVAEPAEAGVSVAPEAGEVRVMIEDADRGVSVVVSLTDGERVGAYASGDAADAQFTTARGRITVTGASAGELRIEIPARVMHAVVELNGALYVVKDQDRLRLVGGSGESTGREVSFTVR